MPIIAPKTYEQPKPGIYLGTVIDVVDLGLIQGQNGPYAALRIFWVLDKNDSKGYPFKIMQTAPAVISSASSKKKSRLTLLASKVLGTDFSGKTFDSELLMGRSNQLCVEQNGEYVNVTGILPFPEGAVAPKAPANFVRNKDIVDKQTFSSAATQPVRAQIPPVEISDEDIPF
jgi:hypothetical protein